MNYHGVRRCCIKDLPVIKLIQKKKCKHVNTNFSFSSRVLANNFFLQGLYIFLFWRDWSQVLAESQSSAKHAVVQKFLGSFHIHGSLCHGCEDVPWTWIKLFFLIHRSWRTEKVIGEKSQSGPIALLSLIMSLEANVYVNNKSRHGSKREDVWLKPEINKCYFGRIAYICGNSPQMQLL